MSKLKAKCTWRLKLCEMRRDRGGAPDQMANRNAHHVFLFPALVPCRESTLIAIELPSQPPFASLNES